MRKIRRAAGRGGKVSEGFRWAAERSEEHVVEDRNRNWGRDCGLDALMSGGS